MATLDAISRYHDLLHQPRLAHDSWELLTAGMEKNCMFFGERPLCTVLRPLLYTADEWQYLVTCTELVLRIFERLARVMLEDQELRAQAGITPEEEHLIHMNHGYPTLIPTARLDSFYAYNADGSRTLSFVEFNGETPASMVYSDILSDLFLELPVMQAFADHYALTALPSKRPALDEFLRVFRQWQGNSHKLPDIAIVDWHDVPTRSEFELFAQYFRENGIRVVICGPDEMEFRDAQLYAAGTPVDFVYRRILLTELLHTYGLAHPMIEAVEAGAICVVNPFACKLLHKKASFAIISDERNAHLLTEVERETVRAHIPWTRVVEERITLDPAGNRIDLLPWASANREGLVLKPNDEYGGKGVLIGWETEQTAWDAALATDEPTIIQERVQVAYEEFPTLSADGRVVVARRSVDSDPFLFHGERVQGCLCRVSSETLLNVTAGGGSIVPVFVVEEKHSEKRGR